MAFWIGFLQHRDELFQHLQGRWQDLFGTKLDVLLYDLTSTYFEGQAEEIPKRPAMATAATIARLQASGSGFGGDTRGFSCGL